MVDRQPHVGHGHWVLLLGMPGRHKGTESGANSCPPARRILWINFVVGASILAIHAAPFLQRFRVKCEGIRWCINLIIIVVFLVQHYWCDGHLLSLPGRVPTDKVPREDPVLDGNVLDVGHHPTAVDRLGYYSPRYIGGL